MRALIGSEVNPRRVLPEHREAIKLEHRLERVRCLRCIIRVSKLAARRHYGLRRRGTHAIQCVVDDVHAPIRHESAGIIPEPAEVEVEPVRIEGPVRRGAQPHVVIHTGRRCRIRLDWDWLHPPLVRPCLYGSDIPKCATLNEVDGVPPMRSASLPLPHLQNPITVRPRSIQQDVAFLQRVRQRLLQIYVLAGFQRFDSHQAVPMIRSADDNEVQVLVLE